MEDDGPNFSYAYGDTSAPSPSTSSWNPALRPNHESPDNLTTVAPNQQPSPQIIPQSKPELDQGLDDEDELPTISAVSAIPAHLNNGVPEREPNSDNGFFDRRGSGDVSQSVQPHPESEMNGHGVNGAEADELVRATQGLSLGDSTVGEAHQDVNGASDAPQEHMNEHDGIGAESSDEDPAQQYEHQGETTLLEDAVAESAKAPLIADAEPRTDDWGSAGEVFDLGGMPQDAPLDTPLDAPLATRQAEAIGTTVGDQVIRDSKVGGNTGGDIDWGTGDDDDFFGGAASQPVESEQSTEQSPGAHAVQDTGAKPAAGTDSVWDIPLDDDFLPDTEEAPLFDLDDDDGFLEDQSSQPAQPVQSVPSTTSRYAPQTPQVQPPPVNAFGQPASQFTNFATIDHKPATTPSIPYNAHVQPSPYPQQPPRPAIPSSAQSFADKAKGGYHSPYDLPDDVITTRRRPAHRTTSIPAAQPAPPPPRTSSMSNASAVRPPPSNISATSLSPPSSGHSMQSQMTGMPPNAPLKPAAPVKPASSDFFAELPVSTKPRAASRHAPSHGAPQPPVAHGFPPKERTASFSSLRNEIRQDSSSLISQLQQPERLPVFPDQPTAPVRSNSLPVPQPPPAPASNRYSPAPAPSVPAANMRYSPAPPTANTRYSPAPPQAPQASTNSPYASAPPTGPSRPPALPYAPRTSSPLAFHSQPHQDEMPASTYEHLAGHAPSHHALHSAEGVPRVPFKTPLEGVSENEEQLSTQPSAPRSETPPTRSRPSSAVSSPRKKGNYTPQYQPNQPASGSSVAPPPRAQSQSPSATMKQSHGLSYNRPASAHGVVSTLPTLGAQPIAPNFGAQPSTQNVNKIPYRRQMSLEYDCIAPTDERAADPLQRWRGAPVFTWGLGGTVVTTFPKQIPRYGGGATMPMMKCCPGDVKMQSIKESLPLSEDVAKFPGPLKAKGKKKDVLLWLTQRIEAFDNQLNTPGLEHTLPADDLKRLEEKTLLWKILHVLVENDGQLTCNATAEAAVRKVLSPALDASVEGEASFSTAADLVGRSRSGTAVQADPVDPRAVEELRTLLTKGDREKAVWHAVDQRLWAHAMLLSSTLNKDVWKQVVQEFVRKEVKKMGRDNQALAVLYEVFAGNHEDCIDELVPASARAGFRMMSTDGAGATQNALQGLDKWQETLSLVLNNRSEGDAGALLALGRLLAGYGRVEAAHICFIFARAVVNISGVDDPQSDMVLVGADHRQNPLELGVDLEPVLLTEVYEFGLSLSSQGGSHIIPHLQNYKLAHAYRLAEYGHRTDAHAYCDAIAVAMKATTRVSPYYNGSFVAKLDDLSKRLSQSPKDGSSWISKPSMDKVSSSLLSKFNNFIAGDNEDTASSHGNGPDIGPFAKIAGDTPALSPTSSNADLYGAMSGQIAQAAPSTAANSRYAPSNAYAPRVSLESNRSRYESQGRPSMESMDAGSGMRTVSDTYLPSPTLSSSYTPSQSQFSPSGLQPQLTKSQSYSPLRAEHSAAQISYGSPYQPAPATEEPSPAFGGYQPSASFDDPPVASAQPSDSYEPSSNSYEPPTSSYEPPVYEPYQPDDEEEEKPSLQPKKSIMDLDDDDDLVARAAALKSQGKSAADKQADDAFRKAAEEDAKRDKEAAAAKKGGWFGSWFKKDPNAAPGPIKAKLGEENSFYFDPELKKWVNKKGGAAEATKPMTTPPPPRSGPPNRAVSNNSVMGPPSSLPGDNHLSAPPTRAPTSNPQRSSSMPPPMGMPPSRSSTPGIPSDSESGKPPVLRPPMLAAGSGPPSRPGTGMSTASSIDDLLGAPQAKKGPGAKKKKGGRYVDVMAKP